MADDIFANPDAWGFETRAIRAGQPHDVSSGAVVQPISLATTFVQSEVGVNRGYLYSRVANPTRTALQTCLASLEGSDFGFAFSSGMAAEDTFLRTLSPGDHIVLGDDAYGGTFRLISRVFEPKGITWSAHNLCDVESLRAGLPPETKVIWVETPTNPSLKIVDIKRVAELAHEVGARVVVDNTFATPYLQQPLSLGADVVVHSTTKYCGGHSDVVGGFLATNDFELAEQIEFIQKSVGAVPSPFDSYLTLRGLKTLAVRMDRHCANALAVAKYLNSRPEVVEVLYPGLASHGDHEIAAQQMKDFGGMVSFRVANGEADARRLAASTKVFSLAESLGAVESLIEHPGGMTHASAQGSPLEVKGDLLRLSVGIESTDDLLADLEQALDSL